MTDYLIIMALLVWAAVTVFFAGRASVWKRRCRQMQSAQADKVACYAVDRWMQTFAPSHAQMMRSEEWPEEIGD